MKINSKDFRVREGDDVNLRRWPTNVEAIYKSKESYQKRLEQHVAQLSSLQQILYASNRYAVLLIFQAMDAAGKDGAFFEKDVAGNLELVKTAKIPRQLSFPKIISAHIHDVVRPGLG